MIFLDSSDLKELKMWFDAGVISGVTTNPVILQKEGVVDLCGHVQKMIDIVGAGFPISMEVPDSDMPKQDMIRLALQYHTMFPYLSLIHI